MNDSYKFSECKGCMAVTNNCWIRNKVSAYSFGDCPCKTCLIKVNCSVTCSIYNNLHARIWREWVIKGNRVYTLESGDIRKLKQYDKHIRCI